MFSVDIMVLFLSRCYYIHCRRISFFYSFVPLPLRSWWSCAALCLRLKNWRRRMTCSCSSAPSRPGVLLTTCRGGRALARCSWQSPDTASASTLSNTSTVISDLHAEDDQETSNHEQNLLASFSFTHHQPESDSSQKSHVFSTAFAL